MKKDNIHNIITPGFKTPEHYFEAFDDQLFLRLKETETIEDVKTSGYKVPKDYFNTLDNNILNQLNPEDKPVIKLFSRKTLYYTASIAASFILLFSLVFNSNKSITIDNLETSSLENYLFQEDYTNDELATLFLNSEISESDFIDVTISEETLNQYLEGIDTEDLIFE